MEDKFIPQLVVNLGAGFLPIVGSDIGAKEVINYDPLITPSTTKYVDAPEDVRMQRQSEKDVYVVQKTAFLNLKKTKEGIDREFLYTENETELKQWIEERGNQISVVIAISPYGYPVINEYIHNCLIKYGIVIVIGNSTNKWLYQPQMFAPNSLSSYYESVPVISQDDKGNKKILYTIQKSSMKWEEKVINKIVEQYRSSVSKFNQEVKLNKVIVYMKEN